MNFDSDSDEVLETGRSSELIRPHAHHDHHSKPYDVFVNGLPFSWDGDHITPQQICELAGQDSSYAAFQGKHGHDPQKLLEERKPVYLGNQHVHHFVTRLK